MKIRRKMTLKRETLHNLSDNLLRITRGGADSGGSGTGSGVTYDMTCICVQPKPVQGPATATGLYYPYGLP